MRAQEAEHTSQDHPEEADVERWPTVPKAEEVDGPGCSDITLACGPGAPAHQMLPSLPTQDTMVADLHGTKLQSLLTHPVNSPPRTL